MGAAYVLTDMDAEYAEAIMLGSASSNFLGSEHFLTAGRSSVPNLSPRGAG
jgi:hypothetical protein